jgi:hypothetical protein
VLCDLGEKVQRVECLEVAADAPEQLGVAEDGEWPALGFSDAMQMPDGHYSDMIFGPQHLNPVGPNETME